MITRRRWTTEEEKALIGAYDNLKEQGIDDENIFKLLSEREAFTLRNRTAAALQKRYYDLTSDKGRVASVRKDESYNTFLDGIQELKNGYDVLYKENQQLKKRLAELEQNQEDYAVMARVMEQARKLVVKEELGEHEKPRFKMDGNGNLNRI